MDGKISNLSQICSVRRYTLTEGKENGLEVLDCDNGRVRFLLNISKNLDVMQMYHNGQNLSFISKNGFTKRETPFLDRFEGGMLYTCGLNSAGGRDGYEIHGSLHNIPSNLISVECCENGIKIVGETHFTSLFGQNLVLKRTVSTEVSSDAVNINDVLENRGFSNEKYCLLYHCNVGYPMLDDGATIKGDVISCIPRTPWAKEKENEREIITAPLPNQEETCYFLAFGKPEINVINKKIGKKLALSWSKDTLPHFVEWKSMACGDYALGIEPSTTDLDDRFEYSNIKASEKIRFELTFKITEA